MDWLEAAREEAVKLGYGPMPKAKKFGEWIASEHNPYIEPHDERLNWLPVPLTKLPEKAEVIYFTGCTSSYRQKNIAKSTFNVLMNAGVDFTVLRDEWCCGSPAQRTGQRKIGEEAAKHNVEAIHKAEASIVITSCAGCYRMMKEDYLKRYGIQLDLAVIHSSVYMLELVKKGELKLEKEVPIKLTYHDPCHLGRHMGVYEEPRELLKAIPGVELIEMPRNRQWAWCCGSGAGVKADFPELADYASAERIREAMDAGADVITSTCPFCYRGLKDGAESISSSIKVYDVIELIEKSMEIRSQRKA
jgi:heterodisulfide reductase subunit D